MLETTPWNLELLGENGIYEESRTTTVTVLAVVDTAALDKQTGSDSVCRPAKHLSLKRNHVLKLKSVDSKRKEKEIQRKCIWCLCISLFFCC